MWLEQGIKRIKEAPKTILRKAGDSKAAHAILRDVIMPRMEPRIFSAITPEYPEGFDQIYQDLIQQGYLPIVLMNHQSHGDGIPASVVNGRLTELARAANPEQPLKGFHLVIASSTVDGATGGFLRDLTNYLSPHFATRHTHLIPYATIADRSRHHTKQNTIEVMKRMHTAISENHGLGFFPEAHMTGGRWKNGKFWLGINGMQHFDEGEFSSERIIRMVNNQKRKAVIIPVGIHGGYNLLNPDIKLPGIPGLFSLFQDPPPKLVQVKVGMPLTEEALLEITKKSNQTQHAVLERAIAELLPEHAQGVFRKEKLPRRRTIFSQAITIFHRGS